MSSTAESDMAAFDPLSGFKTDLEKVVSLSEPWPLVCEGSE